MEGHLCKLPRQFGRYNLSNWFLILPVYSGLHEGSKSRFPSWFEFDDLLPVSLLGFGQPPTNTQFSYKSNTSNSNNPKYPNHQFTISWLSNTHFLWRWIKNRPPHRNGRLIIYDFLPLGKSFFGFGYPQAIPIFRPKISENFTPKSQKISSPNLRIRKTSSSFAKGPQDLVALHLFDGRSCTHAILITWWKVSW